MCFILCVWHKLTLNLRFPPSFSWVLYLHSGIYKVPKQEEYSKNQVQDNDCPQCYHWGIPYCYISSGYNKWPIPQSCPQAPLKPRTFLHMSEWKPFCCTCDILGVKKLYKFISRPIYLLYSSLGFLPLPRSSLISFHTLIIACLCVSLHTHTHIHNTKDSCKVPNSMMLNKY